ncbi:MAG: AAA family ATPase, partial [Candidatus Poribacteria bacterium]
MFTKKIRLRVAELPGQVENKGFVRVDNAVLKKLELEVGDLVEIHGKKVTLARAMPASSAVDLKGIIQMDEITRSNAGANIGKRVRLKKARVKPAEKITLKPLMGDVPPQVERCDKSIGRFIEKLPMVSGNRICVDLPCSLRQEFSVLETVPRGP